MDYKDYYKILGVARNASAEEIRAAFRKLAMQYHPDRNQGNKAAEDKFKEINEAYQALSDPQNRARYDQLGDSYSRWQQTGAPGGFDWSQWAAQTGSPQTGSPYGQYSGNLDDLFGEAGGFSDFFRTIFGGMPGMDVRSGGRARTPRAYEQPVTISLAEAYHGTTRLLQVDGRKFEVKIPAGVNSGAKVRVAGAGPNGGDVHLVIAVADDAHFERAGDDLKTHVTVDLFTALLGGEADVQTMAGKISLKIPVGTQPDQRIRLKGRGMPKLKEPDSKGDLLVLVKVRIPKNLTDEQKALIQKAAHLQKQE